MYQNSYTLKTLDGLISNTYILAIVVAIIFIGISILIANMIAYQGGKDPRDPGKRKVWFFVLAAIATIGFFLWNLLYISSLIKGVPAQNKFLIHNAIATAVLLISYIIIGIALSKLMKNKKYGSIFSAKKTK